MTEIDEARSESMTYRPVWVRSRPIFRFPVGVLHYFAGSVRPVHPSTWPEWEIRVRFGATNLGVSQLTTAETLSPGIITWSEWSAIILTRGRSMTRRLSRSVKASRDRSHLVAHVTRKSEHLLQLR